MNISLNDIVYELKNNDFFSILTHQYPDGDTLGSAYALCYVLQKLGKTANVLCNDPIPKKYDFLSSKIKMQTFEPKYIISVDVADVRLLGDRLSCYKDSVDLCIDHHHTNKEYAKKIYVDSKASATAEIIYEIIKLANIDIDKYIADCLYTGVSTDTGCFKYSNVTPKTHIIAANLIQNGAAFNEINKAMFDTKSKVRMELEKLVINSMEFFLNDKCATIFITNDMKEKVNASEDDIEGFSSIPKNIEGVLVGITFREKEPNVFKVSVRTNNGIDSSNICKAFDGGGHPAAAGCTIIGDPENAKKQILNVVKEELVKSYEWNNNN